MTPSPCTRVCQLEPATGVCHGCGRNLDEIAGWPYLTEAERAAVVRTAAARQRQGPTA